MRASVDPTCCESQRSAAVPCSAPVRSWVRSQGRPVPPSRQAASDVAILNYALTLEYLEAAFYAEAETQVFLKGRLKAYVRGVGRDEAQHRAFLTKVLGTQAVKRPIFKFGSTTTTTKAFVNTAISLEDIGVSAYAGQGPRIKSKQILAAALSIHSVEARHAAWIRTLANKPGRQGAPAPVAFDPSRR